jgi:hypothetical protein
MRRLFVALMMTVAATGCVNSPEQAARDAGYIVRMNDIVCHFAATELTRVTAWLDRELKENPKLAAYVKRGAAEADDVYSRHRNQADGNQRDVFECNQVRELARTWHT